jgi:restriction system protein
MSELKKPGRRSCPPGYQQQQSPNTVKRAGLLPEWVKDYGFLLVIGALVVIAALDQAAKALTWPGLLSVLGAVGAIVIWIWHAVARRRRAKEEARRQQELYAQSCLEQVDAMDGPRFEQYFAMLLRLDGHQDVRVIGGKGDGGVDITSTDPSGRPMAYQCKRLKDRVRIDVIRQLNGSLAHEHPGRHGAVVTSAYLTRDADALPGVPGLP